MSQIYNPTITYAKNERNKISIFKKGGTEKGLKSFILRFHKEKFHHSLSGMPFGQAPEWLLYYRNRILLFHMGREIVPGLGVLFFPHPYRLFQ